jgi:hypothetical protein
MKGLELARTTRQNSGGADLALVTGMFFGVLEHGGTRTILVDRELDLEITTRNFPEQLLRGIQYSKRTAVRLDEISERLQRAMASLDRLASLEDANR